MSKVFLQIEADSMDDLIGQLTALEAVDGETLLQVAGDGPVAETVAALDQAATVAATENPLANAIRNSIIGSIQRATGHTRSEVSQVVASVEAGSGRPILDWLTSGGLIQFIQTIIALLAAFKTL